MTNKLQKIYIRNGSQKGFWLDFDKDGNLYFSMFKLYHAFGSSFEKDNFESYRKSAGVYFYDAQTGKTTKIIDYAEYPDLSHDRQKIAYHIFDFEKSSIYIADKTGENPVKIDSGLRPYFSPNDKYLAYYEEINRTKQIFKVYDIEKQKIDTIRTFEHFNNYAYYWLDENTLYFEDKGKKKTYNLITKQIADTVFIPYKDSARLPEAKVFELPQDVDYTSWEFNLRQCCPISGNKLKLIAKPGKANLTYRMQYLHEIGNELSNEDIEQIFILLEETRNEYPKSRRFLFERDYKEMINYLHKLQTLKNSR